MSKFTIYHNPRCSKSRQTLALLNQQGIEPKIVLYLEQPPRPEQLKDILDKLNLSARDLLRKGETEYRELGLDNPDLNEQDLMKAMTKHPRLIERPIVVSARGAVIGRPPEKVLALLNSRS